jgi:hypothetical protein
MKQYFKPIFLIVVIVLIFIFNGCDSNNEPTISSPFGPKVITKEIITFDHVVKAEIKKPEQAAGPAAAEMTESAIEFETPVHPEGRVVYLEISEMPVELKDTELKNGLLSTRKYGDIEVFLKGFKQDEAIFELLATQKQIINLKKEIIKYLDNKKELFTAVLDGDIPKLKALINEKVDLNVRSVDNITPLIAATILDRLQVVQILLDAHADVNARDRAGWTPLIHFAASNGNLELGNALIRADADINARDKNGTTALIAAAAKGNLDFVKVLVDAGADLNAAAKMAEAPFTALQAAERTEHKEIVDFLKKSGAEQN